MTLYETINSRKKTIAQKVVEYKKEIREKTIKLNLKKLGQ